MEIEGSSAISVCFRLSGKHDSLGPDSIGPLIHLFDILNYKANVIDLLNRGWLARLGAFVQLRRVAFWTLHTKTGDE